MDPGTVVWLPGGGDIGYDAACQGTYGDDYFSCGSEYFPGGTLVYCCAY
jgi:hypothetical protein